MADTLFQVRNCGKNVNLGNGDCLDPKRLNGFIITPFDYTMDADDVANLKATLKAGLFADSWDDRLKIVGPSRTTENKSVEPSFETFQDKSQEVVHEGMSAYTFYHRKGKAFHDQLRKLNGSEELIKIIPFDDENQLITTVTTDESGNEVLCGLSVASFFAMPWVANDGSNVTKYPVMVSFDGVSEMNEDGVLIQVNFPLPTLKNLSDIKIAQATALTAGSVTVTATIGSQYAVTSYAVELAQVTAWVARNAITGNAITVTGVTATTTGYTIAMNTSDTDYPASTASLLLKLAAPSVLAASPINVIGYESNEITVTRP